MVPPDALRDRWLQLLRSLTPDEVGAIHLFDDLARHYQTPDRHYHTLDHVASMLQVLDPYLPEMPSATLELATWFHDVIYDPRAADNEERSAAFATERLTPLGLAEEMALRVGSLILQTKTHASTPDPVGQLFLSADLAILGAPAAEYDGYAAAIRREYGWVPEAIYRRGRCAILDGFLRRPTIYGWPPLASKLEANARANLARELEKLSVGPDTTPAND
jgi:predicted metal-dependent HD superfamily phosphohydrolase